MDLAGTTAFNVWDSSTLCGWVGLSLMVIVSESSQALMAHSLDGNIHFRIRVCICLFENMALFCLYIKLCRTAFVGRGASCRDLGRAVTVHLAVLSLGV